MGNFGPDFRNVMARGVFKNLMCPIKSTCNTLLETAVMGWRRNDCYVFPDRDRHTKLVGVSVCTRCYRFVFLIKWGA